MATTAFAPSMRKFASEPGAHSAEMAPPVRKFASDAALQQKDGVFQLDSVEKDLVHESFTVDTRDHEDHTFCGVRMPPPSRWRCICPAPMTLTGALAFNRSCSRWCATLIFRPSIWRSNQCKSVVILGP